MGCGIKNRKGAGVDERTCLESKRGRKVTVGSNPTPSAFASLKLGYGETKSAFSKTKSAFSKRKSAFSKTKSAFNKTKSAFSGTKSASRRAKAGLCQNYSHVKWALRIQNMFYVYILECNDKRFYIGCTDDLKDRLERHEKGYVLATKNRGPVRLYCYFAFQDKHTAYSFEKYLKSGSGRAFIKRHFVS